MMGFYYTFADSSAGRIIVASTREGVCAVEFVDGSEEDALASVSDRLKSDGGMEKSDRFQKDALEYIEKSLRGESSDLPALRLTGTSFQKRVWNALMEIPFGKTATYGEVAKAIGRPGASRAVGNAIGANPISLIIPCHRVIRSDGSVGGYRWGREKKHALLSLEKENSKNLNL